MTSNTLIVDEKQVKGQDDYSRSDEKIAEIKKSHRGYNYVAIFHLILFHSLSIYFLLFKLTAPQWQTFIWNTFYFFFSGFGVSAGVHRLWAHKTYKATTPMKVLLAICFAASGQERIRYWVRDHRIHHKFSETDADPYDVRRGFFYAHFGWLAVKKSPLILEKGRSIDISDIQNCPIVAFHDRHYQVLRILLCFLIPTAVPVYFWNEDLWIAFLFNALRFVLVLNAVFCLNSFGHSIGSRPYDTTLKAVENYPIAIATFGEGYHNYHHAFPFDYRTSDTDFFNPTKHVINLFAKIGWAYDLKIASPEMVKKRTQRTGDGTHPTWGTVAGVPVVGDDDCPVY